jgi:hypothetical protein
MRSCAPEPIVLVIDHGPHIQRLAGPAWRARCFTVVTLAGALLLRVNLPKKSFIRKRRRFTHAKLGAAYQLPAF